MFQKRQNKAFWGENTLNFVPIALRARFFSIPLHRFRKAFLPKVKNKETTKKQLKYTLFNLWH